MAYLRINGDRSEVMSQIAVFQSLNCGAARCTYYVTFPIKAIAVLHSGAPTILRAAKLWQDALVNF